jgi:hypothetical protein
MNFFAELAPPAAPADDARTCGWFDSSHDLRRGLLVQEHASLETLSGAMSLADWLAWHSVSNQVMPPP